MSYLKSGEHIHNWDEISEEEQNEHIRKIELELDRKVKES